MNFLRRLFTLGDDAPPTTENQNQPPPKYHCIRFMTDRGEQLGMLLTHEEFDVAVKRWLNQISAMPVQEELDEEQGVM